MSAKISTYKLIRSLRPMDVYDIVTRGACSDYKPEIERQITSVRGEWFLDNWKDSGCEINVMDIYLSDTGFQLFVTKKESQRLYSQFKSWGLFINVWSSWYGGDDVYRVGFNYNYDTFDVLHKEWFRNKRISTIIS